MLCTGLVAATLAMATAPAQAVPIPDSAKTPAASAAADIAKVSPYRPARVPHRAKDYYLSLWGVDNLLVRQTASGNLIRFSYRVIDPARAKAIGAKEATPYLIGLRSRAVLQIPVMEQIGQLRQTGLPEATKEYWMVFSNKGNLVKVGDRVNVVIGSFSADGLTVE
jgi:hypothetical protein